MGPAAEIDVATDQALIQYKDGSSSAFHILEQMVTTESHTVGRPVVFFINGKDRAMKEQLETHPNMGALITNDLQMLIDLIKN